MIPIENRSPFAAEVISLLDTHGREVRVLVVVATFDYSGSRVSPAAVQEPVHFGDRHRGDPSVSSVVREADLCTPKPLVDVIVNGSAWAPDGRPVRSITVGLRVGDIHKELRVVGDRRGAGADPKPFERMPIVYERALGGTATDGRGEVDRFNPIGVGFKGARPADPQIRTGQPNIEHGASTAPTERRLPAGFGVVARGWSPRVQLAGTYDTGWLDWQWPLPPHDFDERHHQCAPRDQQSGTIQGGEAAQLVNLTPEGEVTISLPRLSAPVYLVRDNGATPVETRLDTVYLWPDERRIVLCHRAVVNADAAGDPREVVVGHMTAAWLRARCTRRYYVDPGDTRGEIPGAAYFS